MNKADLLGYLERMDKALQAPTKLCVYGSAAFILLDDPDRTSLEIDRADVQYLYRQPGVDARGIAEAVKALPAPFDTDPVVLENLENLKTDV